ncbi:alpha-1,2-mannosidase [Actinoplanes sp. SE50]|uniref:GH92 family glycosyl hydrolase n=1 Tax=unclassified Actinoplanes TaxID=2626549 RepID=UPI00023EC5A9|nr:MULTISPECIES: GH92 family glycosyl hydrolase [unclassified Actinoplanes]AEV83058.1 Neuropilin-1 [Actinoplanes sp. SE50/110]ATO81454.1 alpha-1,2-mannosidase [Actinoplanes sp. SE50]SLL98861.1 alpha-1,2-mannosidase [Actinoplanes sp. SE50/110]
MLRTLAVATVLVAAAFATPASPAQAADADLTSYVNPLIGTDDSNSPNPVGGGAGGSTFPGAIVPFGMTQFSPDTPTASPSGYRDRDRTIESFSLTHFNGAGCPNNEDLPILPVTGALGSSPGNAWTSYASGYTKANETASPGYYKNKLDKYGVTAELSATTRTGALRLTYPATTTAQVLINDSRSATGDRAGNVSISGNRVWGEHTAGGFCGGRTYKIYYSILFDRTPTGFGTFSGGTVSAGSATASGTQTGAYVTFDTSSNAVVNATVGISFVSVANAQNNATAEAASFDTVKAAANAAWNSALNRVQVTAGGATDLQKFYTALYHVFSNPNVASDTNGQYMGFDNAVHTSSFPIYQNYSGWDIYRSWAALVAMVAPEVMTDIVKSMVLDGQQGGLLPKWSQQSIEDFVMPGDPGPIVVDEAYQFGVRGFDTAAALTLMKKSATGGSTQGYVLRGNEGTYESQHYIAGNPSETLEYASSDFAISRFALALGDTATYNTYATHSQYWRSLFNGESSYIHNRSGGFPWPLNPATESPYTEGNAAQYTWMVPHNLGGLITLMGGKSTAIQRLDHHFTQLNGGLSLPYFYVGNEPEHGVPWAYHFAGKPSGASDAVRRVMSESFTTGAGGLPGNDDLGATSAWYVWSALGLYPVTPGADTLAVHGGIFPSVLIRRSTGDLTISGGSATSPYVQSLSVNGKATTHNYLRYADLASGGSVTYSMGSSPSAWGTGSGDTPPSFGDGATPPIAEPDLGANLAAGKPVISGSAECGSSETAAKAVDGLLRNNSKWCTGGTPKTLTVDLGSAQNVSSVVLKHAGLGGETTGWNTADYTIQTSTDNATWTTVVTVAGARNSRSYLPFPARAARYVRLAVTTPSNNGDAAARIYEFEVYGQSSAPADLALRRASSADSSCAATESPDRAFNGSWLGGWSDKWCSQSTSRWLQTDLGGTTHIGSVVLRHAGAGGEYPAWNTRDFDVLTSTDGSTWTVRASVRGNTADSTTSTINADARYVRLDVITPTQDGSAAARIYEMDVRG